MRRSPLIAFGLLALVASLHAWHLHDVLPERVASHFGADGRPNGWASRDAFVGVYLAVIAVVTVCFAGTAALLRRLPASLINLPNKDYWLAPERRDATLAWIGGWSAMFGAATLLLMMALMRQAERVNLGAATQIAGMPLVLSYGVLSMGMLIALIGKFVRRP